ncbi:Uncharacterised protein [Comamonas aquatica]|nr:Uncharacterised protein [Comamonas aquatica]
MGGGVAGVGADGLFQHLGGLAVLALGGVQHGQVVVGLGQLGVVACQGREDLDGLVVLLLFGRDHTLQKAQLHILGALLEQGLHALRGIVDFALVNQLLHLGCGRSGRLGQRCGCGHNTHQTGGCYRSYPPSWLEHGGSAKPGKHGRKRHRSTFSAEQRGGVDKARAFSPVSAWLTKREILGGIDRLTACRGCRRDGRGTPALRVAGGLLPNAAVPGPWSGPARPRGHRGSGARGCAPGPARTRPARPCRRACRHCPRWGRPRR